MSDRRASAQLQRRCGPIGPVSEDEPTGRMLGVAAAVARAISASERSVWRGAAAIRRSASIWPAGLARLASVRTSTSASVGSGAGDHSPLSEPAESIGEHDGHQVGGGDTVDHAVMDLREQRPALALQALDRPQLPQRLVAVEVLGEDAGGHLAQLLLASGLGDGGVAQVVVEAEVRIVDPHGRPDGERNGADLLAVAGHEAELAGDHRAELIERRWRPLEDADAADVHRRGVVLHV